MTADELIAAYRTEVQDLAKPPLTSDEDVLRWLDEGQHEAALRARLIHESENAAVCTIVVGAGTATYALHPALYELDHVAFLVAGATTRTPIALKSTVDLDRICPDWRDRTGTPQWAIQTDTRLRLVPKPDAAGTLLLEGYRLPMKCWEDCTRPPEIHAAHHRHLIWWAVHRAYGIQDADVFDPDRSAKAEAKFVAYFGARPDADLRRSTREDVDQHNRAFWP